METRYKIQDYGSHYYLELNTYVIMSNNIHIIAKAKVGFSLPDIIRDFRKYAARNFLLEMNQNTESRKDWMLKRFEFAAMRHKRSSASNYCEQEFTLKVELL